MKNTLYLVETQEGEEAFFRESLADFTVRCVGELAEVGPDADAVSILFHSRIDAQFLDLHPRLKLITTRSTGYDHIDVNECARRGITVCNVSSVDENTVAEHTFALMLAVSRRLLEVHDANKRPFFRYETLRGSDLRGKTLGVVGTGRVGVHVIHIALAFGMKVLAYDPYNHSLMSEVLGVSYVALDELLRRSHVISLHAPLTADTYHLLDREAFGKCRPGVIVINTARGGLIDTEALVEALDADIVAGVGLDVLEDESVMQKDGQRVIAEQIVENIQASLSPEEIRMKHPQRVKELQSLVQNARLLARPNVVFTPHVAFNSVEGVERINAVTVANIKAFLENHPDNVIQPIQEHETPRHFRHSRKLAGATSGARCGA